MNKAEYIVTLKYCHIRCTPSDDKCKDCSILKAYKEIYGEEKVWQERS